eukprot:TRINITY_DN759_c0_g1_i1.p1 TRINITY_DN759_c0_g1~~TRINITY_DN759_c0_g1_i1.p1  ORF type:complete len:1161 (+),score=426.75 TRINITY_DN759_c0_g1_i1:63-3545(+)
MATATRDAAQRCIVRAVPNGATLHVVEVGADGKERPGSKKTVYLAHVIAPKYRVNKESQDDWAWESREFLRHLVIGRPVWFLEYGEVKEREFVGEVYLDPQQQRNLAAAVMRGGFTSLASNANFISMKDPRRQRYHNDVTAALEDAKRARVGMHSAAAPRNRRQVKYSISEREAAALVETHRGKQLSAVVEYIMSDTTARLSIDDATLYVVVQLTGLRQKNTGKTAGNDHEQDLRNDCHQEAEGLAYKNLMHRDVLLEIDGVLHNKKDRVLGTLAKKDDKTGEKKVWQELLLGRGLLAHHRVQCPYTDRFAAAEEAAKAKNLGRWRYQHGSAVQTPSKPVSMLDHVKAAGGAAAEREEGDGDSAGTSPRTASTGTAHVAATAQQQTVKKLFDAIRAGDAVACKKVLKQQRAAVLNAVHDGAADVDAGGDGPQAGDTPLIAAVRGRHEAIWRLVLDYKPDVDARDGSGATALLWSVRLGLAGLTRLLVKLKADVDGADIDGATPLMAALRAGDADACDVLLAAGADVDVGGAEGDGDTPLICAARAGLGATASALLGRGAAATAAHRNARGETAFHVAAARGMRGLLEELAAAAGGNVPADVPGIGAELRLQSAEAGRRGEVGALEGAVRALWGEVRRARGVVAAEAGAFLEAQAEALCAGAKACESSGDQLFRHIAARNAGACLALLRERPEAARAVASADLDVPSAPGQSYIVPGDTPLIAAARSKLADVCMHLLQDAPAEWVSVRNSRGEAALLWAARHKLEIVQQMVMQQGGDAGEQARGDVQSQSVFMCAAQGGQSPLCHALLDEGLDPAAVGPQGRTPLLAAIEGRLERVAMRLARMAGSDLAAADEGGRTPLLLAAGEGMEAVCIELLDRGADPDVADYTGHTVLDLPATPWGVRVHIIARRCGAAEAAARAVLASEEMRTFTSLVDAAERSRPSPAAPPIAFHDPWQSLWQPPAQPAAAAAAAPAAAVDTELWPVFPPSPPAAREDPAAPALTAVSARLDTLEASVAALQAAAEAARQERRKQQLETIAMLEDLARQRAERPTDPPTSSDTPCCPEPPARQSPTAAEARQRKEAVLSRYGFHQAVLEQFAPIRNVLRLVASADAPAALRDLADVWLWEQKGLAERGPRHYVEPTPMPAPVGAWCKAAAARGRT